MMRVQISARLQKRVEQLPANVREAASAVIAAVADYFGAPHQHAGLGLRKLGRRSFEARVHWQWRVVFILDGEVLTAFDIMTHDEVRRWVRHQAK
jgi:hypothetical protein